MAKHALHPCYYTVGGGINPGESSQDAVVREVFEETGTRLAVDRLSFVLERFYPVGGETRHEVTFFYRMKVPDDLAFLDGALTDQGTDESLHWLPLDRLDQYPVVPAFLATTPLMDCAEIQHLIVRE